VPPPTPSGWTPNAVPMSSRKLSEILNEVLIGIVVLDNKFIGKNKEQLQLKYLYVSRSFRQYGIGKMLFKKAVEKAPKNSIILTLACGKFRFFDKELGAIDEIPRLLDIGQCNDAYSAVKIALALGEAFNVGVNDLPLSIICSWYEQKAVAILLSLLYLGIRNIRLGPSLPAFITPNILKVIVEKFNIMPITTPEKDLAAILG